MRHHKISVITLIGLAIAVFCCLNIFVLQKLSISDCDEQNAITPTMGLSSPSHLRSDRKALASKKNIDVAFGLSGDEEGYLAEFEVALKSLLLNAPSSSSSGRITNFRIHLLCDSDAFNAVATILDDTELDGSLWEIPISIILYNVQPYEDRWREKIKEAVRGPVKECRHTFGTYYRLFANEILPTDVGSVVYVDTDVVVMSNINGLWRHVDKESLFQWGDDRCAGFIVINIKKFDEMWNLVKQIEFNHTEYIRYKGINDQDILEKINDEYPNVVGTLPQEWTISLANGVWKFAKDIVKKRPEVGMLHLNGGKGSTMAYFDEQGAWTKFPHTWGLIRYYVDLPWTWTRFMGESRVKERGFLLEIHLKNATGRISDSRSEMLPCDVREKLYNGSLFSTEMLKLSEEDKLNLLEQIKNG